MEQPKKFALVRVVFGFVWAADAYFKWQPAVRENIVAIVTQARDGQPAWEAAWITLWGNIAALHPNAFGALIASIETALALSLISGLWSRWALWCGLVFSLIIWSVPQGFGGPYAYGVTDVDSGILYALVFAALLIGGAWRRFALFARE